MRRSTVSSSGAVISAIGLLPIQGNTSHSKRRMILSPWLAAQPGEYWVNHSRATTSKLFSCASVAACRARVYALG
jgi:hypothetical protein